MTQYIQGQKAELPDGTMAVYDVKKGWMTMDQSSTAAYKNAIKDVQLQKDAYNRMKPQGELLPQAAAMITGNTFMKPGKVNGGGFGNMLPGVENLTPDANAFANLSNRIQTAGGNPAQGQGTISDYERKLFSAGAPSLHNFNATNRDIIAQRQAILNEQRDYANFLDDYVSKHGSEQGAQEVWQGYTAKDPYITQGAGGHAVALSKDPDRWRRFIYGGARIATPGGAPAQSKPAPAKTASGATVSNW